jgi:ABC-2 type transport system ATP-binding protein
VETAVKPAVLAGVSKSFRTTRALDGLDLAVEEGEILALLGPNGAGKTTAIRVLLGLRRPDAGSARLFGLDPTQADARRRVGCTPQETSFPGTLRVRELVDLVRAHYPAPLPYGELAARFDLDGLGRRQVGGLSGGERRRLACALAFAGDPDLVVLDEPSTGLDVESRRHLWQTIRDERRTTLLTTHYLEEAAALATRVAVIHAGRIVATGSVAEISARGDDLESAYLALTGAT